MKLEISIPDDAPNEAASVHEAGMRAEGALLRVAGRELRSQVRQAQGPPRWVRALACSARPGTDDEAIGALFIQARTLGGLVRGLGLGRPEAWGMSGGAVCALVAGRCVRVSEGTLRCVLSGRPLGGAVDLLACEPLRPPDWTDLDVRVAVGRGVGMANAALHLLWGLIALTQVLLLCFLPALPFLLLISWMFGLVAALLCGLLMALLMVEREAHLPASQARLARRLGGGAGRSTLQP